jgi:hypothetical protein
VGFVFITAGLVLLFFSDAPLSPPFGFHHDYPFYDDWATSGIVGLGMGLLFPLTFWRRLIQLSVGGKAALAIAAIAGLMVGLLASREIGVYGLHGLGHGLGAVVALLIGLPSVLVRPILRSPGEAAT